MVERTDLEVTVRDMVAYDILSKPLSSLGSKAYRRRDALAKDAARLARKGNSSERVVAYLETREEDRARTLREGVEVFKEAHPTYGRILEDVIAEVRKSSNSYLVFSVAEGFKLGAEDYRRVMKDLGMDTREADAVYPHLLDVSDRLGKSRENARRDILL